jgi:hypothetical protein
MNYSDGDVILPECHMVKRKDMKLFCFFLGVFIGGFKSATVVAKREQLISCCLALWLEKHVRHASRGVNS